MKKTILLFALGISAFSSNAQLTLTGTSYTQNFDGIGGGLPVGWNVYSGAGANYIGNITTLNTATTYPPAMLKPDTTCAGAVLTGGFKNFASANVCHEGDDWCAGTLTYTDRALGVRQVSPSNTSHPNLDSGAAYVLTIANTTNARNFNLSFKLQSLDSSSPRTTHWLVDYAIGATPTTFIPATTTTGTWTTGGHSFSNNSVTVDFGNALDNSSAPVTIRVVTLVYSSGSGNRPSTAIDDYSLTWTSTIGVKEMNAIANFDLTVLGTAVSNKINFGYNAQEIGNYNLKLTDLSGRVVYATDVNANIGTNTLSINGKDFAPGMYIATMSNGLSKAVTKVVVQ